MDSELLQIALAARDRSWAPMSNYRVGAALQTAEGTIYMGCNVEHVVLPETACAERVAILKAVSEGERDFTAIAVATSTSPPASPCGSCRQLLQYWGVPRVILTNPLGEVVEVQISELLPRAFTPDDL